MSPFSPDRPEPRRLREALGRTQKQMAALVRAASYRTWQDWEAGRRTMPPGRWELALLKSEMCDANPRGVR